MSARTEILHSLDRLFSEGSLAGLNDLALLQRFIASRDEAAFEILVRRHGPTVLAASRAWLSRPEDLDDAFQATFLVLVQRAASLRRPDRIGPWLYGVATRVAARIAHRRRKLHLRESAAADLAARADESPRPTHEIAGDLRPVLLEELTRLREPDRQAVILCYLEGLTHEQAAERLQWPLGTVKGRLARARQTLRSRLARRGVVASTGAIATLLAPPRARAHLPEHLIHQTLESALSLLAPVPPLVAAAPVALLAQGVSSTMFWQSTTQAAAVLGLAGLLTTGALWASARQDAAPPPADAGPAASVAPARAASERPAPNLQPSTAPPVPADSAPPGPAATLLPLAESMPGSSVALQPAPQPESPHPAGPDDQVALARRRLNLANRLYQHARAQHEQGQGDLASVYAAARRLADAYLDPALLSNLPRDQALHLQIDVITGQLNHAKALWEDAKMRTRGGMAPANAEIEAELEVADLELKLARLKAQPSPATSLRGDRVPSPDSVLPVSSASIAEHALPAGTPVVAAPPQDYPRPGMAPSALADLQHPAQPISAQPPSVAPIPTSEIATSTRAVVATDAGTPAISMNQPAPDHASGGGDPFDGVQAKPIDTDPEQTQAINEALDKKISTPFRVETPLEDVLNYIQDATKGKSLPNGIPIYVDLPSLSDVEATSQSPITIYLDGVKLRTTLRLMLRQLHLTYTVSDGVLVIHSDQDDAYTIHKPVTLPNPNPPPGDPR